MFIWGVRYSETAANGNMLKATGRVARTDERSRLESKNARLAEQLAAREAVLAGRIQENARLQFLYRQIEKRLADSSCQLQAREQELSWTNIELQESRRAVTALRQSWSWRLTLPLRAVMDLASHLQRAQSGFLSKVLGYLQWLWFRPQVVESGLFDRNYYVAQNPDVALSGTDALRHFFVFGAAESRNPHPRFDLRYYVDRNPDVARSRINPLVHYLKWGASEKRKTHPDNPPVHDLEPHTSQSPREPIPAGVRPQAPPPESGKSGGLPPGTGVDPGTTELRMALRASYAASGRPLPDSEYDSVPLVSVVIPCCNSGDHLEDALLSAMLACSYPMEVLVVDDGSTDPESISAVEELAGRYRFRLLRQSHTGLAGACYTGFQNCLGKFIQFLDADDFLASDKIDLQVDMMTRDIGIDVAVCAYEVSGPDGSGRRRMGPSTPAGFDPEDFLLRWEQGFSLAIHCGLFRREILTEKHFRPVTKMGKEDWIFWILLLSASCRFQFHPEVLATFRIHRNNAATLSEFTGPDSLCASMAQSKVKPSSGCELTG